MKRHLLLGCKGCGNAIVEAAFAVAGIALDCEEVDYEAGSPTRGRLLEVNPLGQVPTLVLPDGRILTESLAMIHYLADLAPSAGLIPARDDPARASFHRWSVFLVAAIYPTFTYGDDPKKWIRDPEGAKQLRESTDRHRKALWQQVEDQAVVGPWFLGSRMTALDLDLAAMTRWRPGKDWFAKHTPKLVAIAQKASATAGVADVMKRNFG